MIVICHCFKTYSWVSLHLYTLINAPDMENSPVNLQDIQAPKKAADTVYLLMKDNDLLCIPFSEPSQLVTGNECYIQFSFFS